MFLKRWLKKWKYRVRKRRSARYDRPLPPPSDREQALAQELKAAFLELPRVNLAGKSASEKEWFKNVERLRELVLHRDPREFLRWDVILKTMSVAYADYITPEYQFLKNLNDWNSRWSQAIAESSAGHPIPYWHCPESSENLIHHAYHLAQFEQKTGLQIHDMNFVFEFGGGYGSMCRLFHNLGFRGRYLIFDLAAFSLLQRFFLKSLGIEVHFPESFRGAANGVLCISDFGQLQDVLSDQNGASSLFVATWSLSEAPAHLRAGVLPLVASFQAFLIAYQARFNEMDNIKAFEDWKKMYTDVQWHDWRMTHLANNNRYLIGSRKENRRQAV